MHTDIPALFVEINEAHFIFVAGIYDETQNFKIMEKVIAPSKGINKNEIINLEEAQEQIKKNTQIIENKLNCIFKEATIIVDIFDYTCINISGFKKLNGSQLLKENISYILNSLKLTIAESEKEKTILHIFNSKSNLDGRSIQNLPIGLFGDFYSHELTFFLITNKDLRNLKKLFGKNNLEVKKVLIKDFVEGTQLIYQNDDIETFFKLKINKDSSNLSFFKKSSFRYLENFNFGTHMISKDISKVCSISQDTIKEIFLDKTLKNKDFKDSDFLDEKYFTQDSYKKIRKKLIIDISNARIKEIIDIILNKNININSLKKNNFKVYIIINDDLIFDNFKENFKYYCLKDFNFDLDFIDEVKVNSSFESVGNLSVYGWKKEAIPIPQTKHSLITRVFKYFFD